MAAATIDLDKLSVQQLTALIAEAQAKRAAKMESAKAEFLAEMQAKAAALGLDLSGLLTSPRNVKRKARKPRSNVGLPVPTKYRSPDGEEWSGRGRPPAWIVMAEADGKSRKQFQI